MTIDQYAMLCMLWTCVAALVQTNVPKYARNHNWKTIITCLTMNYLLMPICFVWAMLRWNGDILILIVKEKIKRGL